ncbi:unnamed protein product [Amoebophrya sp. A25]|nr:unnamed protein product [Amoebophrya sp. A25]|eukprot:GSA25T00001373001.1
MASQPPLPEVDAELAALVCRQVILPLFNTQGEELDITAGWDLESSKTGIFAEVRLSEKLLKQVIAARKELRELEREVACERSLCGNLKKRKKTVEDRQGIVEIQRERDRGLMNTVVQRQKDLAASLTLLQNRRSCLEGELQELLDENRIWREKCHSLAEAEGKLDQLWANFADQADQVGGGGGSRVDPLHGAGSRDEASGDQATRTTAAKKVSPKEVLEVLQFEGSRLSETVRTLLRDEQQLHAVKRVKDERELVELMGETRLLELNRYEEELEENQERLRQETSVLERVEGELQAKKKVLQKDCGKLQQDLEDLGGKHGAEMSKLAQEKERIGKERDKLSRKLKELSQDYDKMRQRWKKYRARRKLFEQDTKTCKRCGKEYMESGNFNWSCRTHSSEFGGEMWWCCGKLGIQALGCKFGKHESKDDDEDWELKGPQKEEEGDGGQNEQEGKATRDATRDARIRCYGCRELGHKAKDCPRDPNVLSSKDPMKEIRRSDGIPEKSKSTSASFANFAGVLAKVGSLEGNAAAETSEGLADAGFQDVQKLLRRKLRARRKEFLDAAKKNHGAEEGREPDLVCQEVPAEEGEKPKNTHGDELPYAAFTTAQELEDDFLISSEEEDLSPLKRDDDESSSEDGEAFTPAPTGNIPGGGADMPVLDE